MKKDLISRQKLRMALYHEAFELDSDDQRWDGGCWIRYKMFERVVESMPTESDRERGKWKQGFCSECGYNWGKDAPFASVPNYCPNCGDDMRERRDDE